jgi:hypothetical protein
MEKVEVQQLLIDRVSYEVNKSKSAVQVLLYCLRNIMATSFRNRFFMVIQLQYTSTI